MNSWTHYLPDTLDLKKIAYRLARGGGHKKQAIARAVGTSANQQLTVIDATSGLGTDALVLAHLNCKVFAIERNYDIANLLIARLEAAAKDPILSKAASNVTVVYGDARQIVSNIIEQSKKIPEVIYLDPMFNNNSNAAPNKLIQTIKQILSAEILSLAAHDGNLLRSMLQTNIKKIVVKRPRLAPYLEQIKPNFKIEGKANRFDVYLTIATKK